MELSCKSEYALLALLELASQYDKGEPLQIRQIAAQQNIPDRYLEQLLASLRRCGLVRSQRGAKGGYLLARDPWKITLLDVVTCIEGLDAGLSENDSNPKTLENEVIRDVWKEAQEASKSVLQKYTLKDVCELRNAKQQGNIMYYI